MRLPSLPRLPVLRLGPLAKVDWEVWRPRLGYGAFALVAFLLALRWTFPAEAVRERLILEAGLRGWQFEAGDVAPGGLLGVRARDVRLEDHGGVAIAVDQVDAWVRPLPLLIGRRVIGFDGRVYDGRVRGTAALSGEVRDVSLRIEGLDLARVLPLRKATGLELLGKPGGRAELAIPEDPATHATGRIDLDVAGAAVAGGQLPLPGMATGLTLPAFTLGEMTAAVKLAGGRAAVEKLEARGGDAELTTEELAVTLQPRLDLAPLFGKARVRFQPALWAKTGTAAFKGLLEATLAPGRLADGAYQLQVVGTLAQPRLIPGNAMPAR